MSRTRIAGYQSPHMQVASIAYLLDVPSPNDGDVVEVLGFHSIGDGGDGLFYWDASADKANHDGGVVIDPTITFPSDWDDTTQQTAWFSGGNTGTGCWKRIVEDVIDIRFFGATDNIYILWRYFIDAVANNGGVGYIDGDSDYTTTDELEVFRSNITLNFSGRNFIKLIQPSTMGAVLTIIDRNNKTIVENVTINNPMIDGGNLGYNVSATYGENGLAGAKCKNVQIYGGIIKNCLRGTNTTGSGGKGVQFESGVEKIIVSGTIIENCSIALASQGVINDTTGNAWDDFRSNTKVLYTNIIAKNCDRLIEMAQTYSPPNASTEVNSVTCNNIVGFNCGKESYGDVNAYGCILIDRACNNTFKNIRVINDPTYGAINSLVVIHRGENNNIDIEFVGDCAYLVDHTVKSGFGESGNCSNNIININHTGNTEYCIYEDSSGGILDNLYNMNVHEVTTGIVAPALAILDLYGTFYHKTNNKLISGTLNYVYSNNDFSGEGTINLEGSISILNRLLLTYGSDGVIFQTLIDEDFVFIRNGSKRMTIKSNTINLVLPTSSTGLSSGDLWNDAGTLKIVQ